MCFADVERPSEEVPSFAVAMSAFLKWTAQEHQTSPGTAERYRYSSLALLRFFPNVSLDRINPQEVERFARNAQLGILKGPKKPGGPGPEKVRKVEEKSRQVRQSSDALPIAERTRSTKSGTVEGYRLRNF